MSIQFQFDAEAGILFAKADGLVSFEEVVRHLDEERRQKYLGKPELFDAVAASTEVSPNETRDIVGQLRELMYEHRLGPTRSSPETRYFLA